MYQSWRKVLGRTQTSGQGFIVPAAAAAGRAIVLNGTSQYGSNTDTGTSVPASQSGWRFIARIRSADTSAPNKYIFRDSAASVLVCNTSATSIIAYVGAGADATGTHNPNNSVDYVMQIRSDPANTAVSIETWNLNGNNWVGTINNAASSSATNFQNRNIIFGAFHGPSDFWSGKIDKAIFLTGAGTYNSTMPDINALSGNIMEWTFDSDNGNDTSGNGVHLTLNGSPTFEDTP